MMTLQKRAFHFVFVILLIGLVAPIIMALALILIALQGRPVFYVSERMKTPRHSFYIWKFRTMQMNAATSGVTGGDKTAQITKLGRWLRATRLDELPQLWNILRGDISFVGPRPPLPGYVRQFPSLYHRVLVARPGVTGLATMVFHKHEAALLRVCKTPEETDEVYCRRCIPKKAQLDLIYQRHGLLCFDLKIILLTLKRLF